MNNDTIQLEPAYDFTANGSSIMLYQGSAEICIDQTFFKGYAKVFLELSSQAHIAVYGEFISIPQEIAKSIHLEKKEVSSLSINNRQIGGFAINIAYNTDSQKIKMIWCPMSEPINIIGDESTKVSNLVFHIFNYLDIIGIKRSSIVRESRNHYIEHVNLSNDSWDIEIQSLPDTRENINKLKIEGGYHITHIGRIKKKDNTHFNGKKAQEIINTLGSFLSFSRGEICEPVCSVGFDSSGDPIWESWSSPRATRHHHLSWFDTHQSTQLVSLFAGFWERWDNEDWKSALREVIYWYLISNSSQSIDSGIILTQAAIERLSFEFAVNDKRLLTAKGFKDLWASDKFRLYFSSMSIPLNIQDETPNIKSLAEEFKWLDAPQALTEIRNSLVHPDHRRRGQFNNAIYEAWKLGLWYLELGILAICNYTGTYSNRLKQRWRGEVENVPWTVNETREDNI